jgi:hypothetical protein
MSTCFATKGSIFWLHTLRINGNVKFVKQTKLGTCLMQTCKVKPVEIAVCVPCGQQYFLGAALDSVEGKTGNMFSGVVQERNISQPRVPYPYTYSCKRLQLTAIVSVWWAYQGVPHSFENLSRPVVRKIKVLRSDLRKLRNFAATRYYANGLSNAYHVRTWFAAVYKST